MNSVLTPLFAIEAKLESGFSFINLSNLSARKPSKLINISGFFIFLPNAPLNETAKKNNRKYIAFILNLKN